MSQLTIDLGEDISQHIVLNSLSCGTLFKKKDEGDVYMRVKTVNFLNNSGLLADTFARGDCVVINLRKGTAFIMKGNTPVIKLTGNLKVRKA